MNGIFITARLGSTRLSQKHLIEVSGKTFIEWLAARMSAEFEQEITNSSLKIFIATSLKKENKKFEEIFRNTNIEVFFGCDDNIPLRHLECAKANNITNILSIDGDDILCSPKAARAVLNKMDSNSCYVSTIGLPLGMNVMGYTNSFLSSSIRRSNNIILETGWGKIFDASEVSIITLTSDEKNDQLRLTLDYPEDATFFRKVIDSLGAKVLTISDQQLINLIVKNEYFKLNVSLNEEYWINFNKQKEIEK